MAAYLRCTTPGFAGVPRRSCSRSGSTRCIRRKQSRCCQSTAARLAVALQVGAESVPGGRIPRYRTHSAEQIDSLHGNGSRRPRLSTRRSLRQAARTCSAQTKRRHPAGQTGAARMPGLADMLAALVGGHEVFLLEPGATRRGEASFVAACRPVRMGGVSLAAAALGPGGSVEVDCARRRGNHRRRGVPTHVLLRTYRAYTINGNSPLSLGLSGRRRVSGWIDLAGRRKMPGVSRNGIVRLLRGRERSVRAPRLQSIWYVSERRTGIDGSAVLQTR